MGDKNPIRTLGDYSKPSHEGYKNTIELPAGNNVVPLRSDAIRLVQNGCSFHRLWSEDPNQYHKDFLKLVDLLDLDSDNRERTRLQSLSEAWTRFKDLLQKVSHHDIDRWFKIQIFYDHVSFHLKCEIDRAAGGKLRNKNTDESWEIIENLAFYDHEGWDETKEFVKPVKAISTPHSVPKTPDRRLLELEDQINFLLKGSRLTPTSSSVRTPQAYVNAVHSKSRPRNQNEPLKLNTFAFRERTGLSPQPQVLETTFEDQIRDYMAAHTDRIERFENAIFKQREGINSRMTEMFGLLKELMTIRLSLKYLSPASIKELNKNPSSPKRVHFVNSIVILSANSNTKEDVSPTNTCDINLGDMVKGKEGVKEQGKEEKVETDMEVDEVIKEEESEFKTDDEIEEILKEEEDDEDGGNFNLFLTIEELTHHEWL
ncbi:hypothetical protein Tco_0733480 [Tanacetum coccineum]